MLSLILVLAFVAVNIYFFIYVPWISEDNNIINNTGKELFSNIVTHIDQATHGTVITIQEAINGAVNYDIEFAPVNVLVVQIQAHNAKWGTLSLWEAKKGVTGYDGETYGSLPLIELDVPNKDYLKVALDKLNWIDRTEQYHEELA